MIFRELEIQKKRAGRNADIKNHNSECFPDVMTGLISTFHKVVGKLIKAADKWRPWVILQQKNNHLPDFFIKILFPINLSSFGNLTA
jgi:hypothetical protein